MTLAPEAVRSMFDRIAPVYDAMNRVMTAGLDRRWRRLTAEVVAPGDLVLDACCGTGDLAVAAARRGGRVTGVDFSEPMLERARRKAPQLEWVQGDVLALPFGDASYYGSTGGVALSAPVVGVAPTSSGKGYWIATSGGRVYAFGDAGPASPVSGATIIGAI